jgi:hypothetical protein
MYRNSRFQNIDKDYQKLREKFIRKTGSKLIFSSGKDLPKEPQEGDTILAIERDWLPDIYMVKPTYYYYL